MFPLCSNTAETVEAQFMTNV